MTLSMAAVSFAMLLQTPIPQEPQTVQASQAPQAVQSTSQTVATNPPPAADARDQIVCRNEAVTGRRVPTRVCRSRAQMQIEEAEGQQALRRAQENHRRSQDE